MLIKNLYGLWELSPLLLPITFHFQLGQSYDTLLPHRWRVYQQLVKLPAVNGCRASLSPNSIHIVGQCYAYVTLLCEMLILCNRQTGKQVAVAVVVVYLQKTNHGTLS